jgi:hypothetical protein
MAVTQGTPTNVDKYTFSVWVKRADIGAANSKIFSVSSGSAIGEEKLEFNQDDLIWRQTDTSGDINWQRVTDRKFRDPSAWYHIVVAYDSSQGTAGNRCKMYINGVQETSFSASPNPSSNQDSYTNTSGRSLKLFALESNVNEQNAGAYFSEMVYVDGSQLDPTSFGEFDEDSGIWKPIDVSGLTFGDNGFYCEYKNSGALGEDTSGNSNNLSVFNLTAIDQTTDTPTNNFATLNPLDNYYASSTFSEGNCKIVTNGSAIIYNTSTIGFSSGKWYMETKVSGNVRYVVGVVRGVATANNNDNKLGNRSDGWGYDYRGLVENNGSDLGGSFASYTSGDIIGIYADLDNNELYFSKNGTLQNSGTGLTLTAGTYFFALGNNHLTESSTLEANFGNPTYTGTDQADVNSRGSFEYSPSAGTFDGTSKDFLSLCTKNLSEVLG